jgi:3-oxoacyl-[acyl-carrier protein] reductase
MEVSVGVLDGQAALVTGGGGGIGSVISRFLARAGAAVVVADISLSAAVDAVDALTVEGLSARALELDVTALDRVTAAVGQLADDGLPPDILVTAHGFPKDVPLVEMSSKDWNSVLEVCLSGTYHCIKAVAPSMIAREYGRIATISSRAWHGNPGQANYSAAKAGVVGLTRSVAKELGRYGVTANAIAPGIISTPALRQLSTFDAVSRRAISSSSIKRLGTPEDVAEAAVFLCSPGASFVTGEVIHVSGGRYS